MSKVIEEMPRYSATHVAGVVNRDEVGQLNE